MFTQCGTCPKCGARIFHNYTWFSIPAAPVIYTCACNPQPAIILSDNTIVSEVIDG